MLVLNFALCYVKSRSGWGFCLQFCVKDLAYAILVIFLKDQKKELVLPLWIIVGDYYSF